ncbi:aromatic acid exporter family protein [Microbacterium sp. P05]|uniref:FUSC family protein n=1 Tax=Microbacterium sp. P05 TaxID=3366948 RepID=UPI0037475F08
MRMTAAFRAPRRAPFLLVAKSAIASIAAWLVAGWLVPGPAPVFAAVAALLVVQPSVNQSLTRAVERSIGVIVGVVVASALGILLGSYTFVILLATAVALLVAWALKLTSATANQVAISAILVLALGTATPDYAFDRVLETLIGALIGVIVNLALVPPVALAPAREKVDALGGELGDALDRLADALETAQTAASLEELLLEARLLRPMRDAAEAALVTGAESLGLNPRGRKHRAELDRLQGLLDIFTPISTQVIGMTRAVYDRYDPSITNEPTVRAIAEQLRRAAHDVRLVVSRGLPATGGAPTAGDAAASAPLEPPALTRPLQVGPPSSDHWILVGSLLVDLHRIHETLGETAAA